MGFVDNKKHIELSPVFSLNCNLTQHINRTSITCVYFNEHFTYAQHHRHSFFSSNHISPTSLFCPLLFYLFIWSLSNSQTPSTFFTSHLSVSSFHPASHLSSTLSNAWRPVLLYQWAIAGGMALSLYPFRSSSLLFFSSSSLHSSHLSFPCIFASTGIFGLCTIRLAVLFIFMQIVFFPAIHCLGIFFSPLFSLHLWYYVFVATLFYGAKHTFLLFVYHSSTRPTVFLLPLSYIHTPWLLSHLIYLIIQTFNVLLFYFTSSDLNQTSLTWLTPIN